MAGMGSGLTGGGVLAMETSWVANWRVGATREAIGGMDVGQEHYFIGVRAHEGCWFRSRFKSEG